MRIECDRCVMQHTTACDECVVSFVVGREPGAATVFDLEEERAIQLLTKAGLVPGLRHVHVVEGGDAPDQDQESPTTRSA